MQIRNMKKWDTLLKKVDSVLTKLDEEGCEIPFFRVHSNSSYKLLPTILRPATLNGRDLNNFESRLYYDFVSLAGNLIDCTSSWNVLFNMRHHGLPTRLLDWSESFGIALFFALDSENINNPEIWILNPFKLNDKTEYKGLRFDLINPEIDLDDDYFKIFIQTEGDSSKPELPLALYPYRKINRVIAQKGLFTIHGSKAEPVDKLTNDCLTKISIPMEAIEDAKRFLKLAGINSSTVYPDLDGLSKHFKKKFEY